MFAACDDMCFCKCMRYVHVCECFSVNVCFQITTLAGFSLSGTGESPICHSGDSLLLTHPQSARGNNRELSPPSSLLTAPMAHYCLKSVHFNKLLLIS